VTAPAARGRSGALPAEPSGSARATRRRRGEPRRLLLAAGRELFSKQGFADTSTRAIADLAGVTEPLLFRHFGAKIELFREALVVPFLRLVEGLRDKWHGVAPAERDQEEIARQFLGDLFDLFHAHRGLVLLLWSAGTESTRELAEAGVLDEINGAMRLLAGIGAAETVQRKGRPVYDHELSMRAMLAMVAGMASFGESFYGNDAPSRGDIVEELTQTTLYGRTHRHR
jgi:AcrR family transcriptional regulator